ncbi:MAG: xanthine dehydrogenase family protein molybdopterin-binding subunit, partial [Deltaproteobacteria bacterium]
REVEIIANTGAYCMWGDSILHKAVLMANGPYRVDHVKVDGRLVYTNNPRSGAVRGFGVPQVTFAYETHMNNIAEELGMDPMELRLKNLLKDGDLLPCGQRVENTGIREALERAAAASRWGEKRKPSAPHKRRGVGVACMVYPIGICQFNNPSSAFVSINQDGTATVLTGAVDVGQGSTTVLSQIAAEELGIPFEAIQFVSADTGVTPFDTGSIASRVTFIAGNAIREAAREAREALFRVAEEELGISREGLEAREGRIFLKRYPERSMTIQEAAFKAYKRKGIVPLGKGSWNPPTLQIEPETGHGKPFAAYTYAAQIAEVEVDVETGEVDVIQIVGAHDVGRAINPAFVEGQIYGGIAMGVGYALTEEIKIEKGVTLTDNFTNYVVPTATDVPETMEAIIVEEQEPIGPFGAKGLGESTLLPTAPAILSAIQNATGIKLRELPATPEKIVKALKERSKQ